MTYYVHDRTADTTEAHEADTPAATPIAVVCVRGAPQDTGTLYRDGTARYVEWRTGENDAVRRGVTEFGTPFGVVSRGRRRIAEEIAATASVREVAGG